MKRNIMAEIEAIIFASRGVSLKKLKRVLKVPEGEIRRVIEELQNKYSSKDHGIELREVEGRYRFYTKKDYGEVVEQALGRRFSKLTEAQLEVVVIIVMNGSLTRSEIDRRRGKDSSAVIRTLLEMRVLRKKRRGRHVFYELTRSFKESTIYEEVLEMLRSGEDG